MDYIELQQKILDIAKKVKEENFITELMTKSISRRETINTYEFQNSIKKAEIIDTTENKTTEEKKELIYNYIDSCNDDGYLYNLIQLLYKRIRVLKIDYAYNCKDVEEYVEENNNIW